MSDARLQELARRWRETEDPVDERRYLTARVRSGDLEPAALELMSPVWDGRVPRERLELLAYAGDPLAVAIRGDEIVELASYLAEQAGVDVVFGSPVDRSDLEAWSAGLYRWGDAVVVEVLAVFLSAQVEAAVGQPPPDLDGLPAEEVYEADYQQELLGHALAAVRQLLPVMADLVPGLPPAEQPVDHYGQWTDLVHAAEAAARVGGDIDSVRQREQVAGFWVLQPGVDPGALLARLRAHLRAGFQ